MFENAAQAVKEKLKEDFKEIYNSVSPQIISAALQKLGFLMPAESLTQRVKRIKGSPDYYLDPQGKPTDVVRFNKVNNKTGELIHPLYNTLHYKACVKEEFSTRF